MMRYFQVYKIVPTALLWVLAVGLCVPLVLTSEFWQRFPSWDEAGHGFDGYLLYIRLTKGQFLGFFHDLIKMNYWPPGFALVNIPLFALIGPSFGTPRLFSMICFIASIAMCFLLAEQVLKNKIYSIALSLILMISPLYLRFATVAMLETPSTLLILLFYFYFFKYIDASRLGLNNTITKYLDRFLIFGSILFFFKYNYAILCMVGVLSYDTFVEYLNKKSWKQTTAIGLLESAYKYVRSQGFWLFWTGCIVLVVGFSYLGGFKTRIFGSDVVFRSVANPLYALLLIGAIRIFVLNIKQERHLLFHLMSSMPLLWQRTIMVVIFPALVWMLYPPTFNTFINFIVNQDTSSSLGMIDRYGYYPKLFVSDVYFAEGMWPLGVAILFFFFVGIFFMIIRRTVEPIVWCTTIGFLMCVTHKNLSDRYLLPLLPEILICAFWGFKNCAEVFGVVVRRGAYTLVCALAFGILVFKIPNKSVLQKIFEAETNSADLAIMTESICLNTDAQNKTMILGYWVRISPSLIHWYCMKHKLVVDIEKLAQSPIRLGYVKEFENVESIINKVKNGRVIEIQYRGEDQQQYNTDTHWDAPLRNYLMSSRNLSLIEEQNLLGGEYLLRTYKVLP